MAACCFYALPHGRAEDRESGLHRERLAHARARRGASLARAHPRRRRTLRRRTLLRREPARLHRDGGRGRARAHAPRLGALRARARACRARGRDVARSPRDFRASEDGQGVRADVGCGLKALGGAREVRACLKARCRSPERAEDNSRGQAGVASASERRERRPRIRTNKNPTLKGSQTPGAVRPLEGRN